MTLHFDKFRNKLVCRFNLNANSLQDSKLIVQWMHNGVHLGYEVLRSIRNKQEVEAKTTFHDNGWYQCILKNGLRVLGMAFKKLEFPSNFESPKALPLRTEQHSQRSPYFIYISPDQRISVGGSTKLKCIAAGNPLPRLAWKLNGKVLVSCDHIKIYDAT